MLRAATTVVAIAFALCVLVYAFAGPLMRIVDERFNRVTATHAVEPSPQALALHQRLFIADLHSDALLWNRDLLQRSDRGHVDLPRLQEGGVELQVFHGNGVSIARQLSPFAGRSRHHGAGRDRPSLAAQRLERPYGAVANGTVPQLNTAAAKSNLLLRIATDTYWLYMVKQTYRGVVAIISVEGLHLHEDEIASLDLMFRAGVRVFGLAHMSDNAVAGSAHGWRKYGLTDFGRRVVAASTRSAVSSTSHTRRSRPSTTFSRYRV